MTATQPSPCDSAVAATIETARTTAHPRATLAATILGSSLAFIDGSVVNVALPTIGRDLGAGPAALSWTINAYLLPLGALILLGGSAGDHYGRRRLFVGGILIFLVASALCAAAPSLPLLLAGRGLQGLGAALLMPNSLAILGAAFTGEARGRAIGTWASVGAIAGALGPVLGGWLVDAVGWRAIFGINGPIGLGAVLIAWRFLPADGGERGRAPLDWAGALVVTAALGLTTWALTDVAQPSVSPGILAGAAGLGGLGLVVFLLIEWRRGDAALMPFRLFGTATFVGVTLLTFLLYAALGGLIVLLPYTLVEVGHYPATMAGAAMLPIPVLIGFGSRLIGGLAGRLGGRLPLSGGSLITAVGLGLFCRLGPGGIDYARDILPATLVIGVGMAICVAPLTTTVMDAVDADHVGAASGFNSAVARIGGLIATGLLGFVFVRQGSAEALMGAVRIAAAVGAVSALASSLCAFLLVRGRRATGPAKPPP